jgi:NAD(P)-dependent dehydrogenase (short-subunit alcohol dehydrogenase family)
MESPSISSKGIQMAKRFEDKVVVITGGSDGIGLATARLFAEEGGRVYITGRRRELLTQRQDSGLWSQYHPLRILRSNSASCSQIAFFAKIFYPSYSQVSQVLEVLRHERGPTVAQLGGS